MTSTRTEEIQRGKDVLKREPKGKEVNIGRKERWLSVIGGGALALYGLTRRSRAGKALSILGGSIFYRGKMGHSRLYRTLGINRAKEKTGMIEVEKAVTINRPPEDVYGFWHDLENLPKFMESVESVKYLGDGKSHWVVKTPIGTTMEWDAETTREKENQEISWRSEPGAGIENEGTVRFRKAPGGRGTEVMLSMQYRPPGEAAGGLMAKLLDKLSGEQIERDLKRLKQVMEAGETAAAGG